MTNTRKPTTTLEIDTMRAKRLTLQQRKTIFRDLVSAQDQGMKPSESRQHIIGLYKISDAQLLQIEEEGISKDWPPFDDVMSQAS